MATVLTPTPTSTLNHINNAQNINLNHPQYHHYNTSLNINTTTCTTTTTASNDIGSTHSTPQRKPRRSSLKKNSQQVRRVNSNGQGEQQQQRRKVVFSRSRSLSECSPSWSTSSSYRDSSVDRLTRDSMGQSQFCRVRSFKSTSKGLVRNGESFKSTDTKTFMSTGSVRVYRQLSLIGRSESIESTDSSVGGSSVAESYYRVGVLGANGVGKSALIKQFLASEEPHADLANPNESVTSTPVTVSVHLDGKESLLEFWDHSEEVDEVDEEEEEEEEDEEENIEFHDQTNSPSPSLTSASTPTTTSQHDDSDDLSEDLDLSLFQTDAYTIVFALNDTGSFHIAAGVLRHLREELGTDRAITLVGNKSDLVRQRRVTDKDAFSLAHKFDCKYIETSAELGHQTDELLVGTLRQIRLKLSTSQNDVMNDVRLVSKRHPKWQKLTHLYRFLHGASQSVDTCQNFFV